MSETGGTEGMAPTSVRPKPLLQSRTLWFNIIMAIWNVAEVQQIMVLLPEPWPLLIQSVGNIALRVITTRPVALTASSPPLVAPPAT